ncbi:MAG: YchJ family protein [Alphaproteobacteria bacterium]|nr:YchJ family protein [Alphaproteobacteria bacterium]
MTCPCGLGLTLESCCGPYLAGRDAPTPEALMRSRYTAYVTGDIDYLERTHHPETLDTFDAEDAAAWSKASTWLGLTVIDAPPPNNDEGFVEFEARFSQHGSVQVHRERSRFVREDGRWYFESGERVQETIRRAEPKVGRNDPCPCGSGKKYKKCCGARA